MPRQFIARMCLLCLVLSAALAVPAQQPKSDTDAAVSEKLQAMERDWLNAEKNHDAAAFEKIVADDWIAITPDGKTLYVGNLNDGTVTPIHVRTNKAGPPILVGAGTNVAQTAWRVIGRIVWTGSLVRVAHATTSLYSSSRQQTNGRRNRKAPLARKRRLLSSVRFGSALQRRRRAERTRSRLCQATTPADRTMLDLTSRPLARPN